MIRKAQQGFTMIELMIALVLGLIIMVAVGQVYVMSIRTATTQQAGSSILDANVFGLQQIERNLRLAGLDLSDKSNLSQNGSGIVTSVANLQGVSGFEDKWATKKAVGDSATKGKSDQLTIQYRAPTDIRDCEGSIALGPRKANLVGTGETPTVVLGQIVVERYFLKENNGVIEMRCDAGRYITDDIISYNDANNPVPGEYQSFVIVGAEKNKLKNFGDDGALVIANVDDFRIQFAATDGNHVRYVSPDAYVAGMGGQSIIAVKTSILTKGAVATVDANAASDTYEMLGENVEISDSVKQASKKYIRRVYESNSMLRNSRGE